MALRSGRFPQTADHLQDGVGFCCLGVLCEVARDAGVPVSKFTDDENITYFDDCSQYPPDSVTEWAGLFEASQGSDVFVELDEHFLPEWREATGDEPDSDEYREGHVLGLGAINDAGCPFPVIANLVERQM